MIKTTSALLIVALGQFNYSLEKKEILPKKSGQILVDKAHSLADVKDIRKETKIVSLTQKKSLKKTLFSQNFTASNPSTTAKKIVLTSFVNSISRTFAAKTHAAHSCCMMMSA